MIVMKPAKIRALSKGDILAAEFPIALIPA